jgi:hypothetical protein
VTGARLSPAATHFLRALLGRAGLAADRVRIRRFRSVDWQSLTFIGERHELTLAIPQPNAAPGADRLRLGLADAEWPLPGGAVVADVVVVRETSEPDGTIVLDLEALTLSE